MNREKVKRYGILSILFFLPVVFLLMLVPAKHHYIPLNIVKYGVADLKGFSGQSEEQVVLEDHISVIGFLGNKPMDMAIMASNVKELVYDKFKGFKKFQIVMVVPHGTETQTEKLKAEISGYDELKYWHFVYGNPAAIESFYKGLKTEQPLNSNMALEDLFIVDKDLNQRGRLDDRENKNSNDRLPAVELLSYSAIKISELKNKFGDDLRVLFQEYREKRKGTFVSSDARRASDLKSEHE